MYFSKCACVYMHARVCVCVCVLVCVRVRACVITGGDVYRDKLDASLKALLRDFVSDGGIRKWNQVDSDVIFDYIFIASSVSSSACDILWLEGWRPNNL